MCISRAMEKGVTYDNNTSGNTLLLVIKFQDVNEKNTIQHKMMIDVKINVGKNNTWPMQVKFWN